MVLPKPLELIKGNTYTFDWSSQPNHPLRLSTVPDGVHNGGVELLDDVTIDNNYTTKIVVKSDTDLYYYCAHHKGMGGELEIKLPIIKSDQPVSISEDSELGSKIAVTSLKNEIEVNNSFQLYKTTSGSYFIDVVDFKVGDSPKSPILLTKQKESRGITTTDVFDFEYTLLHLSLMKAVFFLLQRR